MKITTALAAFCCAILAVNANIVGQIEVSGQTMYVWRQFGSVIVKNNTIAIKAIDGASRAYLLQNPVTVIGPDDFVQMTLSGKTLSYDLDLSRVPCHCNAAMYFSSMPAPEPGEFLDYYCDANCVGGQCCPEFDALESNKHTVLTTLHHCEYDGQWYENCDGGGCGVNSWDVDESAIGQGMRIDTAFPFVISHYQLGAEASVTVEQGSEIFSFDDCYDTDYVSSMDGYWEEGMVPIFSLWGSKDTNDMWWLDDRTGCEPEGGVVGCDYDNAVAVFSNLRLE